MSDWQLGLIAAVQKYEDEHPKGAFCMQDALMRVPERARRQAEGYAEAVQDITGWLTSSESPVEGNTLLASRIIQKFSGGYSQEGGNHVRD